MASHERVDWQLEEPTSQVPWFFAANLLVRAILAPSRVFRNSYEKSKEIVAKSCRKGFAQRIELLARRNLENGPENRPKSSKIASWTAEDSILKAPGLDFGGSGPRFSSLQTRFSTLWGRHNPSVNDRLSFYILFSARLLGPGAARCQRQLG